MLESNVKFLSYGEKIQTIPIFNTGDVQKIQKIQTKLGAPLNWMKMEGIKLELELMDIVLMVVQNISPKIRGDLRPLRELTTLLKYVQDQEKLVNPMLFVQLSCLQ